MALYSRFDIEALVLMEFQQLAGERFNSIWMVNCSTLSTSQENIHLHNLLQAILHRCCGPRENLVRIIE